MLGGGDGHHRSLKKQPQDAIVHDMPKRSSIKRPKDSNKLAASIVADAIRDGKPVPKIDGKDAAAVALGRKGGLKGGKARAEKLSSEQRKEIAKKAALARWTYKEE